jgi:hypothetical protein
LGDVLGEGGIAKEVTQETEDVRLVAVHEPFEGDAVAFSRRSDRARIRLVHAPLPPAASASSPGPIVA